MDGWCGHKTRDFRQAGAARVPAGRARLGDCKATHLHPIPYTYHIEHTIPNYFISYHTILFHICHTISSCCILPYLTQTILYHTIHKCVIAKQSLHPITNPSTITTIITNISIHLSTLDLSTLPFIYQKVSAKNIFPTINFATNIMSKWRRSVEKSEIYGLYWWDKETTGGNGHFVKKINRPRFLSGSSSSAAGGPCERVLRIIILTNEKVRVLQNISFLRATNYLTPEFYGLSVIIYHSHQYESENATT